MDDRSAFIRAICEKAEEDTPRLAFADWLDEHAETDADRATAEFIRLSCTGTGQKVMPKPAQAWLTANWQRLVPGLLRHHTPRYGDIGREFLSAHTLGREVFARIRIVFKTGRREREVVAGIRLFFQRGFLQNATTRHDSVRGLFRRALVVEHPLYAHRIATSAGPRPTIEDAA